MQIMRSFARKRNTTMSRKKKQITSDTEAKRGIAHERVSKLKERVETISDI